jgi:hypothetical protein
MRVNIFVRNMDRMPDPAFRIRARMFKIHELFYSKGQALICLPREWIPR